MMSDSLLGSWLCQVEGEACDILGMGEMMVSLAGWAGWGSR